MKTFLKYVMGVLWTVCAGFLTSFVLTFSFWIMIKQAPTLVGWSAFGTIIGAIAIVVMTVIIIIGWLLVLFDMGEDHEFVSWLLNSEDEKMREIYRTWRDERSK